MKEEGDSLTRTLRKISVPPLFSQEISPWWLCGEEKWEAMEIGERFGEGRGSF